MIIKIDSTMLISLALVAGLAIAYSLWGGSSVNQSSYKTYTSSKFGITFQYPKNYFIQNFSDSTLFAIRLDKSFDRQLPTNFCHWNDPRPVSPCSWNYPLRVTRDTLQSPLVSANDIDAYLEEEYMSSGVRIVSKTDFLIPGAQMGRMYDYGYDDNGHLGRRYIFAKGADVVSVDIFTGVSQRDHFDDAVGIVSSAKLIN